jgi:hypothetical protein
MGGGGGVLVRGERTGPRVDVYGFGEDVTRIYAHISVVIRRA